MLQERYVTRRRMFDWVEPSVIVRDVRGGPDLVCKYAIHSAGQELSVCSGRSPHEEAFRCSLRDFVERGACDILLHDGTKIGSIHRDFGTTLCGPVWALRSADGAVAATLRERTPRSAFVRRAFKLTTLVPQVYDMESTDGVVFASFAEDFSLMSYRLRVGVARTGPAAAGGELEVWVLAVACVLAGFEGRPIPEIRLLLNRAAGNDHGWEWFRGSQR